MSRTKDANWDAMERQQQEGGGFDSGDGISAAQIEQDQRAAGHTEPTELHNQESEF